MTQNEEIRKLVTGLESDVEDDRINACRILADEGDSTVLEILREVSFHDTVSVRYFARKAINVIAVRHGLPEVFRQSEIEEIITTDPSTGEVHFEKATFRAAIQGTDVNRRLASLDKALELAAEFGNEQVLDIILPQLPKADTPLEKSLLIKTIGLLGGKNQVRILTPFLKDRDYRVRADTIEALEYIGDPIIYPLIVPSLQDEDNRVKANAAVALRNYGKSPALSLLQEMINSEKVWMRDSATFALSRIKSPQTVKLLFSILKEEPKHSVYAKAVIGLSKIADRTLVPSLAGVLKKEADRRKRLMLKVLVKSLQGNEIDVPGLLSKIEAEIATREAAAAAAKAGKLYQDGLKEVKLRHFEKAVAIFSMLIKTYPDSQSARQAQIALQKLVAKVRKDREPPESIAAVETIEKNLPAETAVETAQPGEELAEVSEDVSHQVTSLINDLSNPDEDIRKQASIKLMGIRDPRALPALEKAAKDSDNVVRYYAKKALRELARENIYHQPAERLSVTGVASLREPRFKRVLSGAAAVVVAVTIVCWFTFLKLAPAKDVLKAKKIVSSSFERVVRSYRKYTGSGKVVAWKGVVRKVNYEKNIVVIDSHGYTYSATFSPKDFTRTFKGDVVEITGKIKDRSTFGTVFLDGKTIKVLEAGKVNRRSGGKMLTKKQFNEKQRREYAERFHKR